LLQPAELDMNQDAPIVFVVDDDESVRDSLRRLFASLGYAVQVFANANAFLDAHRSEVHGCLVLDVHLPDLDGLELQTRLTAIGSQLPIVFLTGGGDIPMTVRAMKAGAVEFLTKPFVHTHLVAAVRAALDTDSHLRAERAELADLRRRYESLTPREREVMAGVVSGLLNKQIGAEFGTTEATVKEQRANVMSKMKASSLPELVRMASRLELGRQTSRD
jgi:FixJ family two-component response regulator